MTNHDAGNSSDRSSPPGQAAGGADNNPTAVAASMARLELSMADVHRRLDLITDRLGIVTAKPLAPSIVPPPLMPQLPPPLPPSLPPPLPQPGSTTREPPTTAVEQGPSRGVAVPPDFPGVVPAGDRAAYKRGVVASLFGSDREAASRVAGQSAQRQTSGGYSSEASNPATNVSAGVATGATPRPQRWSGPPVLPPPLEPTPPAAPFDWEKLIGGKAFAALGAVAVCIGAVLFLKLAISEGWFSGISPGLRCALTGVAGFGLLGAGEFVRRRYGAAVSTGISAAGIGISYASVLAAWGWYSILSDGAAFSLLACVAGVGVVVAVVSRQPIVAVVGLLGAYMAPVLLYKSSGPILVMPVYLTVLLCAGQIISLKLRGWFSLSGAVAWWGTLGLGGLWCMSKLAGQAWVVLGFVAVVYVVMHMFALLRAKERQAALTAAGEAGSSTVQLRNFDDLSFASLERVLSRGLAPLSSFSVSGWCAALAVLAVRQLEPSVDWTATAVLTAASLALCAVPAMGATGSFGSQQGAGETGSTVGPGRFFAAIVRVLQTAGGTLPPVAALAFSFMLQGASLLLVTVSLAVSDDAAVLVWLAMAVGAVAAGRKLRSVFLDGYGLLLLALALRGLVVGSNDTGVLTLLTRSATGIGTGLRDPSTVDWLGLQLGDWNLKVMLAAMSCVAIGRLLLIGSNADGRQTVARSVAGIGIFVMLAAPMHANTAATAVFAAWGVLLLGATQLHFVDPRLHLPRLIGVVAVPVSVMALAWYVVVSPGWTWLPGLPILHRALLAMACYVVVLLQCRWLMYRSSWALSVSGMFPLRLTRPLLQAMGYTAVTISFLATTLETARITHMVASQNSAAGAGISMYWSVLAVACIALGLALPGLIPGGSSLNLPPRGLMEFLLARSRRSEEGEEATVARARTLATMLRRVGLGLLMVTLLKVVIIDLASVSGLWRVASFLATGGLMIGVAMAYARLEKAVVNAKLT